MSRLLFVVLFPVGNSLAATFLKTERITLYSKEVKDSFDIHITLPLDYDSRQQNFPVIFYLDANLKSGNKLRSIIDDLDNRHQSIAALFVGVGHFGNEHALRRRDFVTPYETSKHDSLISTGSHYGRCQNFYRFLENELIPFVDKNYRVTTCRSLIGHSLGGLFTFYCLFKKNRLFNNFIALSPSFWINDQNIFDFEKRYRIDSATLQANVYIFAGGAEKFNFILYGTRKMKAHLERNPLLGLNLEYHEFPGETHNSEVPLALTFVLPKLKLQ